MDSEYANQVAYERDMLFDAVEKRLGKEALESVTAAYNLAEQAHDGQVRKTGEPYIIHPLAVAQIVDEEFNLDTEIIMAALLHDVVEDTQYTSDDIRLMFGDTVAELVGVVTKQKKDKYVTSKQVDNFNQMLNSFNYNINALLIKLADRLHNMRTLKSMKIEKQLKIAGETDFFYAPLANRLGLHNVKTELENLSLQYRSPHEYARIKRQLDNYVARHSKTVESWMMPIKKILADNGIDATVKCNARSVYSLWYKMHQTKLSFKELEHIRVVNIIFKSDEAASDKDIALKIYSLLTDIYTEKPFSLSNYIDTPKDNGYQSLHFKLMGNEGRWMEVHVQSEQMQQVSQMGCLIGRESNVTQWIEKFRSVLKDLATQSKEASIFDDVISSFYHDDIVVFAGNGQKITLPKGASAIDFAYEIHSAMGNNANYAIINDRLCAITTRLERGDRVKIGTNEESHPKEEWLNYAKTYKARKNIRQYLHALEEENARRDNYVFCDECRPLPGDEVIGFRRLDEKVVVHKCDCHKAISLASQQGDIIEQVTLHATADRLFPVTLHIKAVNRNNFLLDLMEEISRKLNLSIDSIESYTNDEIIDCHIKLYIHSVEELNKATADIQSLPNVYEVRL